jgi:hypothetical protein
MGTWALTVYASFPHALAVAVLVKEDDHAGELEGDSSAFASQRPGALHRSGAQREPAND